MKNFKRFNSLVFSCSLLFLVIACKKDKAENMGLSIKEAKYVSAGNYMAISLKSNESIQLTALLTPGNREAKEVLYTHKYPALLSISAAGLLSGKAVGRDTLTVTAAGSSSLQVSYVVDIIAP